MFGAYDRFLENAYQRQICDAERLAEAAEELAQEKITDENFREKIYDEVYHKLERYCISLSDKNYNREKLAENCPEFLKILTKIQEGEETHYDEEMLISAGLDGRFGQNALDFLWEIAVNLAENEIIKREDY